MTIVYAAVFIVGIAVGAAVAIFAFVWFAADVTLPQEYPGARHFIGGVIQGIGYILAAGCPLALLVRTGQGSKFHFAVIPAFLIGAALFGALKGPVLSLLSLLQYAGAVSLLDLFR